jgi:hypothetical protein
VEFGGILGPYKQECTLAPKLFSSHKITGTQEDHKKLYSAQRWLSELISEKVVRTFENSDWIKWLSIIKYYNTIKIY